MMPSGAVTYLARTLPPEKTAYQGYGIMTAIIGNA
jgi:hypothetical protein